MYISTPITPEKPQKSKYISPTFLRLIERAKTCPKNEVSIVENKIKIKIINKNNNSMNTKKYKKFRAIKTNPKLIRKIQKKHILNNTQKLKKYINKIILSIYFTKNYI